MVELTRSTVRGFTGVGRFTIKSGVYYEGEWKDGLYDGQGTFVDAKGRRFSGQWVRGKQEGFGQERAEDHVYFGYFKENRYDGTGTYFQIQEEEKRIYTLGYYHGTWRQGKKDGEFVHLDAESEFVCRELWQGREMTTLYLDAESEPDERVKACQYFGAGMWVQLPEGTFLFDVSNGPIPAMHKDRPVFVMVSGTDESRFNDAIFSLAEDYPDIYFLLPGALRDMDYTVGEIEQAYGLKGRVFFVRNKQRLELGGVSIQAIGDESGLAFLVEAGERRLLHGGTLHLKQNTPEAVQRLSRTLSPYWGLKVDLGMLPFDRADEKLGTGTIQFLRTFFSIKEEVVLKLLWGKALTEKETALMEEVLKGEMERTVYFPEVMLEWSKIVMEIQESYEAFVHFCLPDMEFFLLED